MSTSAFGPSSPEGRLSGLEFKLATADLGNGVSTVSVAGEVDLATAPELKEALTEVVNDGARCVLVDLSNATFARIADELKVLRTDADPLVSRVSVRDPSSKC